jgi:NADH:ubiquinone reductase (non-electrogenic)
MGQKFMEPAVWNDAVTITANMHEVLDQADKRRRVVILGGGFGGFRLAAGLSPRLFNVTIVSPRDHFLFTPLLASTVVGTTEFRSIIEPLSSARKGVTVYVATATSIELDRQIVHCMGSFDKDKFELGYDTLVIGVGAAAEMERVPGVAKEALALKELSDARQIRRNVMKCVERAALPGVDSETRQRLLHFVVVGGGPTGVECAGELYDFVHEDLIPRFSHLGPFFKITLLEAATEILSSFDRSLADYTRKSFAKRGIEVRTGAFVSAVTNEQLTLRNGELIPFGVLVWSTGITPTDFVKALPVERTSNGRISVDRYLRVKNAPNVFAIGDCASVEGSTYPATAQAAQQQGAYLAKALTKAVRGKDVAAFRYLHLGMLASIGGGRALADVPGIKWRGFSAWLVWRSVYLTKLVSLRNKFRVFFDWIRTSLFGRDVTTF